MNRGRLIRWGCALCVTTLLLALTAVVVGELLSLLLWARTAPQGKWIAVEAGTAVVALAWLVALRLRSSRMISREIARGIIDERLKRLPQLSYGQLLKRCGETAYECIAGGRGREYRVETRVRWERPKRPDNLRVTVSVAGGGIGTWRPLRGDVLVAPNGSFVRGRSRRPAARRDRR